MRIGAILGFLVIVISAPISAESPSEPLMPVHEAYTNGDFDEVLARIENYQKRNPRHSLADSVFIAKHLAVVYASNPQTREKGRYFMFRMLELNPSADLVDMFISQEMDQTFEKVRKEFLVRQSREHKVNGAKTVQAPTRKATPEMATSAPMANPIQAPHLAKESPKSGNKTWLWVTGGVAIVAGAITAYYVTLDQTTDGNNHPLD